MGDLSEHFSASEFTLDGRATDARPPQELVWRLEDLRHRIGRPLPILSWKRSAGRQRLLSRARRSEHLTGRAVDIPSKLVTVDQALASGFRGIGVDGRWVVHLDIRPTRHPVIFDDVKYRR